MIERKLEHGTKIGFDVGTIVKKTTSEGDILKLALHPIPMPYFSREDIYDLEVASKSQVYRVRTFEHFQIGEKVLVKYEREIETGLCKGLSVRRYK